MQVRNDEFSGHNFKKLNLHYNCKSVLLSIHCQDV